MTPGRSLNLSTMLQFLHLFRSRQTFSIKSQIANILGFAYHIWSLSRILCLFVFLNNPLTMLKPFTPWELHKNRLLAGFGPGQFSDPIWLYYWDFTFKQQIPGSEKCSISLPSINDAKSFGQLELCHTYYYKGEPTLFPFVPQDSQLYTVYGSCYLPP